MSLTQGAGLGVVVVVWLVHNAKSNPASLPLSRAPAPPTVSRAETDETVALP
jgi:hypothetical protein